MLSRLEDAGAEWAPRPLGIDADGWEVVTWIDGDTASTGADIDVLALARIVRQLHDETVSLVDSHGCVIHDDLQPRNIIVREGRPVGIVDWEQARPGERVEDVANLCWSFAEPTPTCNPFELASEWRSIVDAYGLDSRRALLATVLDKMARCASDIEREAAGGSRRHRLLADRGDHIAIRSMLSWTTSNRRELERVIDARERPTRGARLYGRA